MFRDKNLILLMLVSIALHFVFFGYPSEVVFDEVHFGKFVSGYFTHQYFFDIHPPLGKLLIATAGHITGFSPGFTFTQIDQPYPNIDYIGLRLLPMIAGTVLPIIIYLIILRLGMSQFAAFTGGLLTILDNALLVQSRFILLDIFLILFGFTSLLFYLIYKQKKNYRYLLLASIFATLSFSIKWTGLAFIGIIIAFEMFENLKKFRKPKVNLNNYSKQFITLLVIPLMIYFTIFAIHFSLLYKSGTGDAFMSPSFQKTLEGSKYLNDTSIQSSNVFQKFVETNLVMFKSNFQIANGHPYASAWYTWPLMIRPIFYWVNADARIYLIGNPIIWWLAIAEVLYLMVQLSISLFRKLKIDRTAILLLFGYLINLLPFIFISSRPLFLYHYLAALVFSILILTYAIDKTKHSRILFSVLIIASLASFLFFSPLTYGIPMNDFLYNLHVWIPTWK